MQKIKNSPNTINIPSYQIIGHRGAGKLAPENTLKSFKLAKTLGLSAVEFDAQVCASGEWILMHDDSLDRTSNGTGLVAETSFEKLKQLKLGKDYSENSVLEPIPLLSEALEALAVLDLHPNIEIKSNQPLSSEHLESFLVTVQRHWTSAKPPPLISSFDKNILFEIKDRAPQYPLGYNIETLQNDTLSIFNQGDFFSLHCNYEHLTTEALAELLLQPFPILLYTVNDAELAQAYLRQGIWGIFSDFPNFIAQSFFKV